MKFHVYDQLSLNERTHNSEWCCTPFDKKNIGQKPKLNNSYHHIGKISSIPNCNPSECDYFLVPYLIRHTHHLKDEKELFNHLSENLAFFKQKPEKHIFFVGSDETRPIKTLENSIVFAFSVNKSSKNKCLYYQPIVEVPKLISSIALAHYDVSFQGYFCNDIRKKAANSVSGLKNVVINKRYWLEKFMGRETKEIERNYVGLIQMSKFVLCPRGFGMSSVRFFETMASGRIPVLISDETKLPIEHKINYDEFVLRVKESEIDSIPQKIYEFKEKRNLIKASIAARQTWEKWFCPENFHNFLKESLNIS